MGWREPGARGRDGSFRIECFECAKMWCTFGILYHCKRDRGGLLNMSASVRFYEKTEGRGGCVEWGSLTAYLQDETFIGRD